MWSGPDVATPSPPTRLSAMQTGGTYTRWACISRGLPHCAPDGAHDVLRLPAAAAFMRI